MGWVIALLWIIAAMLAVVVLLLALTWHVEIAGHTAPAPQVRLSLRLISDRWPAIVSVNLLGQSGPKAAKAAKAPARRKRSRGPGPAAQARLAAALPRLASDTLAGIHLDRVRLAGRFGLSDPAATGELWGRLCPFLWMPRDQRIQIAITPDFGTARIEGEGLVALHARPVRLAAPAMRFLLRRGLRW